MNKKLIISDLSLDFGKDKNNRKILSNINFDLEESEIGCILGPSGCGKTSLLRAIEKKKLSKEISAFDKSKDVSIYLAKNFSFKIAKSVDEAVKDSDLIIIASPLSSYKEILLSIKSSLKKNVILTDTE